MNRRHPWWAWLLSIGAICAWLVFHLGHVIACMDECLAGAGPLADPRALRLHLDDMRLSTWILASSQHALMTPGVSLLDANAFHPAPDVLAGAEHLLGLAVWSAPLRLIDNGAVFVHQGAYVLSYAILGGSMLALVRWLTGSLALATLAAIVSMAMPWRISEMAHIQLLVACWFPLCWLFTFRLLERQGSWRDVLALVVVLGLQLLSSYYLTYLLTVSLGVIAAFSIAIRGIDVRSLLKLAVAAAVPYGLLIIVSLPYLRREGAGELLDMTQGALDVSWLTWGLEFLRPKLGPELYSTGAIPAGVLLFSILALGWWRASRAQTDEPDAAVERARVVSGALWLVCGVALVMMFPPILDVGGRLIYTPVYLVTTYVPGFENIRAPHRWAILVGIAMPALMASGLAWLARVLPEARRRPVIALATLVIVVSLPWVRLEVARADDGPSGDTDLYESLGNLPPGPVLEIPWEDSLYGISMDSGYLLASTRHGRPILNGYTGYPPPSYFLLRRIAAGLPDRMAIEKLSRLSGVRWIVVHRAWTSPDEIVRWRSAAVENGLRPVYLGAQGMIFAVPRSDEAGSWVDRIRGDWPADQTLGGFARVRLELPEHAGAIRSFDSGTEFVVKPDSRGGQRVNLTIENQSGVHWPGLDLRDEGLVHLSYAFFDSVGERVIEGVVPIDEDLHRGTSQEVSTLLESPRLAGQYLLRLELVQRIEGRDEALPVTPLEIEVSVADVVRGR